VRWFSVLVCATAAYRLAATPLSTVAYVVAAFSVASLLSLFVLSNARSIRVATALQHFAMASGGFLLFVSVAVGG
jgi:uncharacterized membrane protein YcfT